VREDLQDAWEAFCELHAARGRGFGIEPISASDVQAWLRIHSIPRWRWQWFWRLIQACDRVVIRQESKHAKSKADS
jgi:hypothetical protein